MNEEAVTEEAVTEETTEAAPKKRNRCVTQVLVEVTDPVTQEVREAPYWQLDFRGVQKYFLTRKEAYAYKKTLTVSATGRMRLSKALSIGRTTLAKILQLADEDYIGLSEEQMDDLESLKNAAANLLGEALVGRLFPDVAVE